MADCPRCGTRMHENDETTKLLEYVCPACHETEIDWKLDARGRSRSSLVDATAAETTSASSSD